MRCAGGVIGGLLVALIAHGVAAQTSHENGHVHNAAAAADALEFLEEIRTAALKFADRNAAIAAGYRRLGPDFPGMGEHWIHPLHIVTGRLDPAKPSVLCYTSVAGRPVLVGVAFTVALRQGEIAASLPFGELWHEHSDGVDAESLLLTHPGADGDGGSRLAMVHAWPWIPNAGGAFAQNNWALPFARLGLVAHMPTADAAQAASLAGSAGRAFYGQLVRALGRPDAEEQRRLDRAIDAHAAQVDEWAAARADGAVSADEMQMLERVWTSLWQEFARIASPVTRAGLERFEGRPRDAPVKGS